MTDAYRMRATPVRAVQLGVTGADAARLFKTFTDMPKGTEWSGFLRIPPTAKRGGMFAHAGDWVVRAGEGDYFILNDEDFRQSYEKDYPDVQLHPEAYALWHPRVIELEAAITRARTLLDEDLGDTDLTHIEDDRPAFRAFRVLDLALRGGEEAHHE